LAIKTSEINLDYFKIKDNLFQTFKNPGFSFRSVANVDIARKMQDGKISRDVVELIKFVFQVRFATHDQISRGIGKEVSDKTIDELVRLKYLNVFTLGEFQEEHYSAKESDLKIYVLDFAGIYVLNYEGVDTSNWRYTDYFKSSRVVRNNLVQGEVVIAFRNLRQLRIREYKENPEFRIGQTEVNTDFSFSLAQPDEGSLPLNFIGFISENGYEDLNLSDRLRKVNSVFHETKAGLKYYPLGQQTLPILMVIAQTSTDTAHIKRTAEVVGRTTDYAGTQCIIIGYDELVAKGFAGSRLFVIRTNEDPNLGIKNVQVGIAENKILL
jgi:hypothetical protein